MKFSTKKNAFRLTITGYQIPEVGDEPFDVNWLVIWIEIDSGQEKLTLKDSCLTTFEVEKLANWLEQVQTGSEEEAALTFQQPVLGFRLMRNPEGSANNRVDSGTLRVYVSLPWDNSASAGNQNKRLEFPLSEIDLQASAANLREQLKRYPPRAEH